MMMMMTRRITATAARNGRASVASKNRNAGSARNAASAPRRVRGMRDIIAGSEGEERRRIEDAGFRVARRHGFSIVETPVVESQEVFRRCLGSDTDVVSKEMYSFEDKSASPNPWFWFWFCGIVFLLLLFGFSAAVSFLCCCFENSKVWGEIPNYL